MLHQIQLERLNPPWAIIAVGYGAVIQFPDDMTMA